MEQRVLKEIKEQIEESDQALIEGHTMFEIPEQVGKFLAEQSELRSLGFIGCKLKSLRNLVPMKNLRELNLQENQIKDDSLEILKEFTGLKYLYLAGNKIERFESLSFIKDLNQLRVLDLVECPLCKDD